MKDKKGVIMYYDILEQLEDFSDKDFRQIIEALIEYDKSGTEPNFTGEMKVAFKFIKASIDRDNEKYQAKCEMQRQKIQKYWNEQKNTTEYNCIQKKLDIDTDIDIDKDIEYILSYLNEKAGTAFRSCRSNNKFIQARLKDHTVEELKAVVDKKVEEWKGTDMQKYLRPETLFNATKFESYLCSLGGVKQNGNNNSFFNNQKRADTTTKVGDGVYKI